MFENIRQDWHTHDRDITRFGFWAICCYRFGRWRYTIKTSLVRKPFSFLYKLCKVFTQILTGIELPCEVELGKRFKIEHFGTIIISGDTTFGDDVIIRQGVTIGLRHTQDPRSPVIGNNVDIGAGAKILGPIHIGNNVAIGANAVVISDVPDNSIAVGIPARILPCKSTEIKSIVFAKSV